MGILRRMREVLHHLSELLPEPPEPDDLRILGWTRRREPHHLAARIRKEGVPIFDHAEDLQELSGLFVRQALALDDDGGAEREIPGKLGESQRHANP